MKKYYFYIIIFAVSFQYSIVKSEDLPNCVNLCNNAIVPDGWQIGQILECKEDKRLGFIISFVEKENFCEGDCDSYAVEPASSKYYLSLAEEDVHWTHAAISIVISAFHDGNPIIFQSEETRRGFHILTVKILKLEE